MGTRYAFALVIYSIVLVGLLLFVLMWSLGMKQDGQFTRVHYLISFFILLNIGGLIALPFAGKFTRALAVLNFALLIMSLIFALSIVIPMDFGFGTITFLIAFVTSAFILLVENIKHTNIRPSTAN